MTPIANVIIKTQLNGYLTEVAFQEGQMVKKGDFLAQIDPRPYQVLKEQVPKGSCVTIRVFSIRRAPTLSVTTR